MSVANDAGDTRPAQERHLSPEKQARVVERMLPHIDRMVSKLAPYARPPLRDELIQRARLAVAVAASRFDPDGENRFASYAAPWIAGAVHDGLRFEAKSRIESQAAALAAREFTATASDHYEVIWDPHDVNRARLREAAQRMMTTLVVSMSATENSPEDTLIDATTRARVKELVAEALARLDADDQTLYQMHYAEHAPQQAIAARLGVDVRTVRRRHEAMLQRAHRFLSSRGVDAAPEMLEP